MGRNPITFGKNEVDPCSPQNTLLVSRKWWSGHHSTSVWTYFKEHPAMYTLNSVYVVHVYGGLQVGTVYMTKYFFLTKRYRFKEEEGGGSVLWPNSELCGRRNCLIIPMWLKERIEIKGQPLSLKSEAHVEKHNAGILSNGQHIKVMYWFHPGV